MNKGTGVAQTILDQLGGGRFITMTGARELVGTPNALRFRLPANLTVNRCTHMEVRLVDDLYDLCLFKVIRGAAEVHEARSGVHVEQLRETFTRMTGLETSL